MKHDKFKKSYENVMETNLQGFAPEDLLDYDKVACFRNNIEKIKICKIERNAEAVKTIEKVNKVSKKQNKKFNYLKQPAFKTSAPQSKKGFIFNSFKQIKQAIKRDTKQWKLDDKLGLHTDKLMIVIPFYIVLIIYLLS